MNQQKGKDMLFHRKRSKKEITEEDKRLAQAMRENKVGFKDGFAMFLAAMLTLVLPCFLILAGICVLAMFLFGVL